MNGLELSKQYYEIFGKKMLHEFFQELESEFAIGLVGSGSECLGFDDEISKDHDFEPGFCIFVKDDIDEQTIFKINRAYSNLPSEYLGYKKQILSPVGGNRHGAIKISDFIKEKTGKETCDLSLYDYFTIPEQNLLELTNGEIWRDDSQYFTNIRKKLSTFPLDVKLKKIAGELILMAQSGQYNFSRCIKHGEQDAARLAINEFVNSSLHVIYLLNDTYMPYYKWRFKMAKKLLWPKDKKIISDLSSILHISNEDMKNDGEVVNKKIDEIASIIIEKLLLNNLVNRHDNFLERYGYEVNNHIKNIDLRNMHILSAV